MGKRGKGKKEKCATGTIAEPRAKRFAKTPKAFANPSPGRVTFQDEFRSFLKKYGIDYDERYVWD